MQIEYAGQRDALPQPQIANSEQINVRWRVNVRMFPNNLPLFLSKRLKKTREGLQKYNYTTKKTVCQIFFTFFVKKVGILRFFLLFLQFSAQNNIADVQMFVKNDDIRRCAARNSAYPVGDAEIPRGR